jgi:hypothetical protein
MRDGRGCMIAWHGAVDIMGRQGPCDAGRDSEGRDARQQGRNSDSMGTGDSGTRDSDSGKTVDIMGHGKTEIAQRGWDRDMRGATAEQR